MILLEHKKTHRVAIWLLVFSVLPVVGFIIYLMLGAGVNFRAKKLLNNVKKESLLNNYNLKQNLEDVFKKKHYFKDLIAFNIINNNSKLLGCENLEIFSSGEEYFKDLKTEILKAKKQIYFYSYIFASDIIGNEILSLLCAKLLSGVKVVLMFDSFGSRKLDKKALERLKNLNAEVIEFFPPTLKLFQLKMNYRNHRKIVVIDDKLSYIGGINVRDDHLSKNKKRTPWRDTQIKIIGNASLEILKIFLEDVKVSTKNNVLIENTNFKSKDKLELQILKSTPVSNSPKIEEGILRAFKEAKSEIVIQSPYLILDDVFFSALKQCYFSGIKIKVIIPKLKDGFLVHNASLFYAKKLLELGIEVYLYNGFIHSKTILIDNDIFICGSSNIDMRSFSLNFEIMAFVYNSFVCKKYKEILKQDFLSSEKLSLDFFKKMKLGKKLALSFSKLFSPIL